MKKIIYIIALVITLGAPSLVRADNIDHPVFDTQPVLRWGNSSYHDSLGLRDPWVLKDNGTTYLYYDCTEDLLNPSFESNLTTNGWDTYEATLTATTEKALYGAQSLKMVTNNVSFSVPTAGAFTGNYYYDNIKDDAHLAVPSGLEVTPGTMYIASVYVWANAGDNIGLVVIDYKDDPGIWTNHIEPYIRQDATGAGSWQRLSVRFTTSSDTKALTLSFVAGPNTTTYWDGVQLERITDNTTIPSSFPATMNFNKPLQNTIGWRPCVATSTDGVNFQKKGPLEIQGQIESWQNYIKPGWVGTDSLGIYVFPYQGKWYGYTWVAGYQIEAGNPLLYDPGLSGVRRLGYEDRRAFLPNGNPRSALLEADSPLGPFQRVNRGGPVTYPSDEVPPTPINGGTQCSAQTRTYDQPFGCDYLAASGVPVQINGQWVLFLDGQTWHQKGLNDWWGSWTTSSCHGDIINSAVATSNTPLGPWIPSSFSPLFTADDLCKNALVPEGPMYYFDKFSGKHIIFVNQLQDASITAFWTTNPLAKWQAANRKVIIDRTGNGQFTTLGPNGINLPTLLEDGNILSMYFGYRENHPTTNPSRRAIDNYLFHDIGRLTFQLPLFAPTPLPGDIWGPANIPDGHVDMYDFNKMRSNFGNPYTIYNYNDMIGNFGT